MKPAILKQTTNPGELRRYILLPRDEILPDVGDKVDDIAGMAGCRTLASPGEDILFVSDEGSEWKIHPKMSICPIQTFLKVSTFTP